MSERSFAVIAHRGANRVAPENTLPAFEAAVEMGVDYVEIDLAETADGELIVIHNSTVDERTDGTGEVRGLSLEEIQSLDAGSWFGPSFAGTRIPTADEAMELLKGRTGAYLDSKGTSPEKIVALIQRHGMLDSSVVYHSAEGLALLRGLEPRVRTMMPRPPEDLGELPHIMARLRPAVFGLSLRDIGRDKVSACQAVGAEVFVNVMSRDEPAGWEIAMGCRADALETDCPGELLAYLGERGLHR